MSKNKYFKEDALLETLLDLDGEISQWTTVIGQSLRLVEFSQESAYEGVDFLGLLVGCDFPGADRPHRLVSDHDSLHLSGCEVLQASGNLLTENIEHLAAFPLF